MRRPRTATSWMTALIVLACTLIIACGGGGIGDLATGGGQGGTGFSGGQGGTGMSAGTVTAFGSIYVNGVHYDTSGAEIFVEGRSVGIGDPAVLAYLAVGMVVRVEGDIEHSENGTADRVYFNDDLRGPVEAGSIEEIDSSSHQLVVLGKTVVIDGLTNIIGVTMNHSIEGRWIQVSGFEDAEGRLQATFVAGIDDTNGANLKGTITEVDPSNSLITINARQISYQHAVLIDADTIERVDLLGTANIDAIELEGIISEKTSATEFLLNDVPVVMDAQTVYSAGEADDIAEDVRVEVEGVLINGTLYANRVIFLSFAKVEADVAVNDLGLSMITLRGLSDILVRYSDLTKVTGAVTTTNDVSTAHHVKILGRMLPQTDSATVLAVHIITKDKLDAKIILQGALESDPPWIKTTITILDHDLDISGVPDGSFESPGGIGYTAFFTSTEAGDIVSTKGTRSGNVVTWESVTVE